MLEWKVKTGDEKLKDEIRQIKKTFDEWFKSYWAGKYTREEMLSENSPVEHIYFKMMKTFDEVKEKYPLGAKEECASCGKYTDKWIETTFSFCDEYGCGMSLCGECIDKLQSRINEFKTQ